MPFKLGSLAEAGLDVGGGFLEAFEVCLGGPVLHFVGDHDCVSFREVDDDDALAARVAFVLEELGERQTGLRLDDVWEQLAAEAGLLGSATVGEIEQHRVERVEINAVGVPAGVEVTGLVLGGDETPVQPHLPTPRRGEQLDRFREPVEQTSPSLRPAESLDDLVPRRGMLARR